MSRTLTDFGEEWMMKTNLDSESVTVGLYDDTSGSNGTGDSISDTSDVGSVSTEPTGGNYTRQSGEALSAADMGGNWGVDNDTVVTFDVTGDSGTVDSYFVVANFQASSDTSTTDHLVITGALSQSYDVSNLDTLEISAGDDAGAGVGVSVD
jgi:hypothetical protein